MDFGGNMFCLNGNSNGFAWGDNSWETAPTTCNNSSRFINSFHNAGESSTVADGGVRQQQQFPYGGDGSHSHVYADPHLTCLKLGKRQYFEDASGGGGDKRGRGCNGGGGVKAAARCQVEGCHVALVNAKEYHRRHKVCEIHSKAPKVVVMGMEQRFCQQCSRFHAVSEFDDSKRSCRRRLAGHNERRRKSSHDSVARNSSQERNSSQDNMLITEGLPYLLSEECALSLLSTKRDSWLSPADLSTRCSAALRELIAENRAASMARQFVSDRDWNLHHHAVEDFREIQPESNYFPHQMFPQTQ